MRGPVLNRRFLSPHSHMPSKKEIHDFPFLEFVKELMEKMGGNVRAEMEEEQLRIILVFH